jgi:hypothetical protein
MTRIMRRERRYNLEEREEIENQGTPKIPFLKNSTPPLI